MMTRISPLYGEPVALSLGAGEGSAVSAGEGDAVAGAEGDALGDAVSDATGAAPGVGVAHADNETSARTRSEVDATRARLEGDGTTVP
ncbi:hypothetical protein HR12_00750 [Microbacterium sp. SUBG005]|nr:hypothetical protein HR12_00750 [Microbacterium sp. SUBG005]